MKIVVVVASGLHIGYVGCYGNDWVITPNLDRLAAGSVVFDQHIAANPQPDAEVRIWQTGRYLWPVPGEIVLPTQAKHQERSSFLKGNGVVCNELRLQIPRAETDSRQSRVALSEALERWTVQKNSLLHLEVEMLQPPEVTPEECLELFDDDEDGEPVEENERAFHTRQQHYAAMVNRFDQWLGRLLDEVERGSRADAYFLLTTDTGHSLGEHSLLSPSWSRLHEEIIHIPLIIRLPRSAETGRRVFALTQPVDILPTLCELFGILTPVGHGHSLVPLLHGKTNRIRAYTCTGLHAGEHIEWNLRSPEWSFHFPVQPSAGENGREPLLYVRPDDRWEVNNLRQHHLEWAERLERTLRTFAEATRAAGPFQPPSLPDFITKDEVT